jgi:hypothetical protein
MKRAAAGVVFLFVAIASMAADSAPSKPKIVDQSYYAMQTIASMRSVRIAIEAYHMDNGRYPAASTVAELVPKIQPTYIRTTPERDAWGTPFLYRVSADGQSYVLASAGSDRAFDENAWNTAGFPTSSKEDAVYKSSGFEKEWLIQRSCN